MSTVTAPPVSAPAPGASGALAAGRSGRRRTALLRWLFVAPALLYMAAFFGYPLVRNVLMSFQHFTPTTYFTGEAPFNGLDNWRAVFADPLFTDALWHTALFTVGSLLGQFTLGLALAVFFSRRFRLSRFIRAVLLLPWLVPMVVAAVVWRRILDQEHGVLNSALRTLGLTDGGVPWLSSPDVALLAAVLVNIWIGIPFNMVILYGGLQEIPRDLYEAASLDGAGPWRVFRSVTLPLLRPVITVVLVLGFMSTVKILDLILALTSGGPADATQTLGTVTYQMSFQRLDFGQGAVVGNVLILISAVFAVLYLRANRADFGNRK
ncbi:MULTISPECIES: sugar ABC transporter permease [unclassified Streptomyces]|uniref:carbohydrate ABC transporter permease n=1 Tax=unclassified Streptomyces TaxID=2593676 RepID=UPI002DD90DF4|nr:MULTISPECIES: sugar ABC transporter permease [unclassified Streptomyces]WSA90738.1 sugar ABC transporter permease [Streptomyces sp. NBC_01795]WSB75062.1 sugar ABC transporter permease [Streptomyces sp. NBC_01775]WSS16657.1 sugar ABC transporter permease [Streptomyces sp. NBC_01186]WSS45475.1 sugar ABC transporter permease [Streptomyces sp. NBC_01187]